MSDIFKSKTLQASFDRYTSPDFNIETLLALGIEEEFAQQLGRMCRGITASTDEILSVQTEIVGENKIITSTLGTHRTHRLHTAANDSSFDMAV